MSQVIRAAGGLVFRETPKGRVKVLVAHRPGYDDWGLPKGKGDEGESDAETALREVLEETGFRCRIVSQLPTTRHRANGSIKEVAWFAMKPLPNSPGFKVNSEVDQIRWLAPQSALKLVDYTSDEYLIATSDFKRLRRTGTVRLLRHALAGARNDWDGDDRARPLNKKGRSQVAAIVENLAGAGIDRVISSPFLRCVETAKPIAKRVGVKLEVDDRLGEDAPPAGTFEVVQEVAGYNAVLCTHGDPIGTTLKKGKKAGMTIESPVNLAKASTWKIEIVGGVLTTARYVKPPKV